MSLALTAGLWGLLGASSLIAGAAVAFLLKMPRTVAAGIMSFGCGVLISAVAYDLLEDGFHEGGIWPIVGGALAGSVSYAVADRIVSQQGGHCRKRSGNEQRNAGEGGGLAIAIGSLLDGIPESVVLGLGLLSGQGVSIAMLSAIFLSNFPEGLSSALGMRSAGRSAGYIFGLWSAIAVLSGIGISGWRCVSGRRAAGDCGDGRCGCSGRTADDGRQYDDPRSRRGRSQFTGVLVVSGLLVAFAFPTVLVRPIELRKW
jgi:ZIP family zinc transporter